MLFWGILSLLRVLLVFVPQSGYIHPDEFFQSTEIAAGDIFNLQVHRTWEFTSDQPIRSPSVIYLTTGVPIWLLSSALRLLARTPDVLPPPYLLLVVPRLFSCLASFVCDYTIHRLSVALGKRKKDRHLCLSLFASSYVAVVYYTRTFNNSVESWLLALLLLSVGLDLKASGRRGKQEAPVLRNSMSVCLLLAVGFFNRPTFVVFALPAISIWLLNDVHLSKEGASVVLGRLANFIPKVSFFAMLLAATDTVYYHPEVLSFATTDQWLRFPLVLAPLNFLSYNLNNANLQSHGEHPRWLHFLVNIPLLFNAAGILALWASFQAIHSKLRPTSTKPNTSHAFPSFLDITLASTVLVSTIGLSTLPHQEPRFLVPLLVPVVLLSQRYFRTSRLLSVAWTAGNLAGLVFFGFLHQGGLVPCLFRLQDHLASRGLHQHTTVFFRHTYMPPRHLLTLKHDLDVKVIDLMGAGTSADLMALLAKAEGRTKVIVMPVGTEQASLSRTLSHANGSLEEIFRCRPHLSAEDFPDILHLMETYKRKGFEEMAGVLSEQLSLGVFKVAL
ncbi:GPI mannosyltransferase 4 [Ixodes scapularis]